MYFPLDVSEISAYDKRHATVWKPRGRLAYANNLSRFGREGRRRDGGTEGRRERGMVDGEKTKEHLGALLSNFISALKKSTQTP